MVDLVEGMVYAYKIGLDVGKWMEAISTGAAGSKSLELYGKRTLFVKSTRFLVLCINIPAYAYSLSVDSIFSTTTFIRGSLEF